MAIRPEIPLSVQPFQARSPLESFQRAMSIRDMISNIQQEPARKRLQQLQTRTAELDLTTKELQVAQEQKNQRMQEARNQALIQHRTFDEEKGWQYDIPAVVKTLGREYPELAMQLQSQQKDIARAASLQSIEDWEKRSEALKNLGNQFGDDQAVNEQIYNNMSADTKAFLNIPQKPTPEAIRYAKDTAERMATEAERKAKAERIKIESEGGWSKVDEFVSDKGKRIIAFQGPVGQDGKPQMRYEEGPVVQPSAPTDKARETARIEAAYAFKLKKKPEDLTPLERVEADSWYARMTPDKATDIDKRIALWEKDPKKYAAIFGRTDVDRPLTQEDVGRIIGQINDDAARLNLRDQRAEAYKKGRYAELEAYGVDLKRSTKSSIFSVTAPNGKAYEFDTQAQADEFKRRAGIK